MLWKANWDKTLQKSLKSSYFRKSIRKEIRPSCRKNLSTSFCVCLVSWKQWNLKIWANIPKWCRRPVVSLLYSTESALAGLGLYCSEFMLGMRTCLPCHIPHRWSRNANRIWPDVADLPFGFNHKKPGDEINANRLVQFASFCSFLPTFLILFTGRLWIVLACLQEFSMYQRWSKLDALLSPIEFSSPGTKIGVWINSASLN